MRCSVATRSPPAAPTRSPTSTATSRALLETAIDVGGASLTFASAHLSFYPSETARQAAEVARLLQPAAAGRLVLAGDFNVTPGSTALHVVRALAVDAFSALGIADADCCRWSFPNGERCAKAIDHVFLTPDLAVEHCSVHLDHSGASDHNPVVVDVRLPG